MLLVVRRGPVDEIGNRNGHTHAFYRVNPIMRPNANSAKSANNVADSKCLGVAIPIYRDGGEGGI